MKKRRRGSEYFGWPSTLIAWRPIAVRVTARVFHVAMACTICLYGGISDDQSTAPAELIQRLTGRVSPIEVLSETGLFSCGAEYRHYEVARSLAQMGAAALPLIDKEIERIATGGQGRRDGIRWLLLCEAAIGGPSVLPRLRALKQARRGVFLRGQVDSAIAEALSLTSYLSGSESEPATLLRPIHCRSDEPRDVLNHLILAWLLGDRAQVERSLSDRAQGKLAKVPASKRTNDGKAQRTFTIGYRIKTKGRWAEPDNALRAISPMTEADDLPHYDFTVVFVDAEGTVCAERRVSFHVAAVPASGWPYFKIDSDDLDGLFQVIDNCSAATRPAN